MADNHRNMRVFVRVRPFSLKEMEQNQRCIIKVLDSGTLMFDPEEDEDEFFFHGVQQSHRDITKKVKKKLSMDYDHVFDTSAQNNDIFSSCMKPIVQSVMDGYNCSVFVYGATGAGKTFTMLGSEECPGITYLTMQELFQQIDTLSETRKFDIGITYLEVYNELVMNLLTKSPPLKLREDAHGVVVSGLALKQISGATELLDLLALGNRNRTQHPTDANAESSRSHAIFQVHIRMTDKKTQIKRTVKLSMIDLAGSERAASTKCKGMRFKEGANINKSLLALGNCINKLAEGSKHIPYRDSNLTRILKDSLGGNCKTVMIANVSPSSLTYDDTYNTLKYADRAKKIKNVVKQNIVPSTMPKEFLLRKIGEQHELIEQLKLQKAELALRLQEMENNAKPLVAANTTDNTLIIDSFNNKLNTIFDGLKKAQENYFRMKSKENILHLRIKLKEQVERLTKVFVLDGSNVNANLKRIEAAKDKYAKQAMGQKEAMDHWRTSYKEFRHELIHLKNEIEKSPVSSFIYLHLNSLQSEFTTLATKIKNDHLMKIHNLYRIESEIWKETMALGGEIIQENYLLLKNMGCLDNVILEKMESLAKLHQAHHAVKFSDDDEKVDDCENDVLDISMDTLFDLDNDFEDHPKEILTSGIKRLNSEESDDSEAVRQDVKRAKNDQNAMFVKPKSGSILKNTAGNKPIDNHKFKVPSIVASKAKRKLIAGAVEPIFSSDSEPDEKNMNDTFNIEDKKAGSSINDILVSRNANALKVVDPPSKDLVKKVKATINKENKRYSPKRIGKSPLLRSNSRTTTATTIINKYRMKTAMNDPHSSGDGVRPFKVNGSKK